MSITKERKTELIQEYRRGDVDTGSPEVQIAVLSSRISQLTEHLKGHVKDHAGRRGLLMLVSKRRKLLNYLESLNKFRYSFLQGNMWLEAGFFYFFIADNVISLVGIFAISFKKIKFWNLLFYLLA